MEIEFKLKEANLVRENLVKGAIQSVIDQVNKIPDSHLVNCKQPQIFLKIKLDIQKECQVCETEYDKHTIVDLYEFAKDGKLKENTTSVLCKKCTTKLKVKL